MPTAEIQCFSCHKKQSVEIPVGRRDECSCGSDLHCCYNCLHHDRSAYNECKEPQADVVKDKDRSNYCDHFSPASTSRTSESAKKSDLRAQAEALFKKK